MFAMMARVVLQFVLALAALAALTSACSVPPGSCTKAKCAALKPLPTQYSVPMGYWYGIWNNVTYPNKTAALNQKGGPYVNYEIFTEVGDIVGMTTVSSLPDCCTACAALDNCYQFHYFDKFTKPKTKSVTGFVDGYNCYLLKGGSAKDDDKVRGTPYAGTHTYQKTNLNYIDASWVGGTCNGLPGVKDDPHFSGALGTRFDFNGEASSPFCLVTDDRLHINILMAGYHADSDAVGHDASGKDLRTWIQEVGITWRDMEGTVHTARMTARKGKKQARGSEGFMSGLEIDGEVVPVPQEVGERVTSAGDFSLTYLKAGKKGLYDMDTYSLKIADLADVSLHMRAAHPLLQTPDEAYAHFNLHFNYLSATPKVHGVLGQTYRQTMSQAERALQYSLLSKLLNSPIVADGKSGEGFLDGKTDDYKASSLLATDCAYSAFVV